VSYKDDASRAAAAARKREKEVNLSVSFMISGKKWDPMEKRMWVVELNVQPLKDYLCQETDRR
jgi:hypothetical protein